MAASKGIVTEKYVYYWHESQHYCLNWCHFDVFEYNPSNIRPDSSWSRRLEDLFRLHFQKTSSRRFENVFKASWSRPIYSSWSYVFKTSSRRLQDVFKTFSRRLAKLSSRHLQDVFKTSSRYLQDVFKTSSKRLKKSSRRLQNVFKASCKNAFKTSSRCFQGILKTAWRHLQVVLQRYIEDVFKTYQVKLLLLMFIDKWDLHTEFNLGFPELNSGYFLREVTTRDVLK